MDKLKPCPFCGGTDLEVNDCIREFVECKTCRAFGPDGKGKEDAIKVWNTRPAEGLPASIQEALNSGDGTYRP